jgi:hypothetical protein
VAQVVVHEHDSVVLRYLLPVFSYFVPFVEDDYFDFAEV